jgi:phospholipid/cholesterol/gamma-HCH transport system substrate-binding protein
MSWKDRAIEIKVGVFLLASLGILVAFILVLGNFRFSKGHNLFLDFPSSGGLREGAKVKIAGVKAGSVQGIEFMAGQTTSEKGEPIYVRAKVELDADMARSVTEGSQFFVTTEGLLGERYVEIVPGPPDAAPIPDGTVCLGKPPVELAMVTSRAADMLEKVYVSVDKEGKGISNLVDNASAMIEHSSSILKQLDAELPDLLADARQTVARTQASLDKLDALIDSGRQALDDEDGVRDLVASASSVARQIDDELPYMLASLENLSLLSADLLQTALTRVESLDEQVTATAEGARRLISQAAGLVSDLKEAGLADSARKVMDRVTQDLTTATGSIRTLSTKTEETVGHLNAIASSIRNGKGTLGAFLQDREIYDDVRELILDLKKNPWKVLWKP